MVRIPNSQYFPQPEFNIHSPDGLTEWEWYSILSLLQWYYNSGEKYWHNTRSNKCRIFTDYLAQTLRAVAHSDIPSHLPETIKILCTVGYHHIFSKSRLPSHILQDRCTKMLWCCDTMHWRREQHWSIGFPELVGAHFLMKTKIL